MDERGRYHRWYPGERWRKGAGGFIPGEGSSLHARSGGVILHLEVDSIVAEDEQCFTPIEFPGGDDFGGDFRDGLAVGQYGSGGGEGECERQEWGGHWGLIG